VDSGFATKYAGMVELVDTLDLGAVTSVKVFLGGYAMANHNFSFAGGDILSKMGATWFVSYAYYDRVDKNHRNWDRVSTAASRTSRYIAGIPYHKEWLQEVLVMKDENLSKNTIGLDARQVKAMAKEILDNWK
jgi:hypothetical protein